MPSLPANPIPDSYRRIVLVNPTKYLGNLLIAGGLIQDFYRHCRDHGVDFLLVLDESFRELLHGALPEHVFLFYPRQRIKAADNTGKIRLYWSCLKLIRDFRADIAFNIEEDSVCHRLTQLSGAKFKLGCSVDRHRHGYEHVLRVIYAGRISGEKHRWYGFRQSFRALGMSSSEPAYIKLEIGEAAAARRKAEAAGVDFSRQVIALHPGATKDFKRWPLSNFIHLAEMLLEEDVQLVLIGAGGSDSRINREISENLQTRAPSGSLVDLCDQFSLAELAAFFTLIDAIVGNDSGPFHLAAATGLPGCVIFGPTEDLLWGPLSNNSLLLKGEGDCAPQCTKTGCIFDQRCLKSITPEVVFNNLQQLTKL